MANGDNWTAAQIKGYVEALLVEKDRALAMADSERERAAAALRGEQQRALDQAGRERDKAAENLRVELARATYEGDERLREHIANQIQQINAALAAAERAQDKFEESVTSRFAQVNEFRSSLDDLGKTMATRREMEQAVLSLQGVDAQQAGQLGDLRSRLDVGPEGLQSLRSWADIREGHQAGVRLTHSSLLTVAAVSVGAIGMIVTIATFLITH